MPENIWSCHPVLANTWPKQYPQITKLKCWQTVVKSMLKMLGHPSENHYQSWRPFLKMLAIRLCQMILQMWEVQGSTDSAFGA